MTYSIKLAAPTALALCMILLGCEQSKEPTLQQPTGNASGDSNPEPKVVEQKAAPLPPPCEAVAPAVCAGPLVVNVENVTLLFDGPPNSRGGRSLSGTATLVLLSRSAQPIQVAMLDEAINLTYRNGTAMTLNAGNSSSYSGLSFCGRDGVACVNNQNSPFATINPSDSPLRVTLRFRQNIESSEVTTLANASTADLTMSLWVIESDPAGERRTISVGNSPVENGTL